MPRKEFPIGKATRDAYGAALVELGDTNPRVVALDADLSKSTKSGAFAAKYPDRFVNVGIAEANMVGIASGLAACGKIPFASSFASFLVCKGFDQMRMGVAYSELPVKLVGSHGGITLGEDGVSQMSIEDISLATSLPEFVVLVPADEVSTKQLVLQMADVDSPVYMRTGRAKVPIIYDESDKVTIGKAHVFQEGGDVAIIACGIMVAEALMAAQKLEDDGISATVIDIHTIKPLDEDAIAAAAKRCGAVVTAEEHQVWGGLGAAVAGVLGRKCPVPLEIIGVQDRYAESGQAEELKEKYGLTAGHIVSSVRKVLERKS